MIAIDTNILVYAFDTAYPKKRAICKTLIESIFMGKKKGVITNQILAEFCAATTKKIENPITRKDAQSIISSILTSENWTVLNYTGETIEKALESQQPFWDALITQTLREHNIQQIITENVKDFQQSGIKPLNPLNQSA